MRESDAQRFLTERDVALLALRNIADSAISWRDEERDALLETIGITANQAIGEIYAMEEMSR